MNSSRLSALTAAIFATIGFSGSLDDVRLYDRALSSGDVSELYQQGLSTLTVTTTSDDSDGATSSISALKLDPGADGEISLREAIIAANNTGNGASPDRIHFNISTADGGHVDPDSTPDTGDEYWVIRPQAYLGDITDPVSIDATTQPRVCQPADD